MEKEANQLYRRPQMTGQARDEEEEDLDHDSAIYFIEIQHCIHIKHTNYKLAAIIMVKNVE